MLCLGLVHGDLSEYNVLVAHDGPVIIDFPQVVSAAGNNAARTMLLRDVHNLRDTLARFAPELATTHYGEEMWALFEKGELLPDSKLTGVFVFDESSADVDAVMASIESSTPSTSALRSSKTKVPVNFESGSNSPFSNSAHISSP